MKKCKLGLTNVNDFFDLFKINSLDFLSYCFCNYRQMRQMNNMMNSIFADPFAMLGGNAGFGGNFGFNNALMHSMIPARHSMVNYGGNNNRLLGGMGMPESGVSYSSSSVFSMSTGLDGRPQIYQASSSTKTGPNGIKETKKTVQDSQSGIKKMAIGHHIDNRSKIIEKEQNIHTGAQEERQEFINLDESDGEDFDQEFQQRARQILPNDHRRSLNAQPLLAIQS